MSQEQQKISKNFILNELVSKQLIDIPTNKRLIFSDLKRISKYLDVSIFNDKQCSLWKGYITNNNNDTKGTYINFYFRNKKVALHRLIYNNFVDTLDDNEYLKFMCENKGKCCSIHHLKKFTYNTKSSLENSNNNNNKKTKNIINIKEEKEKEKEKEKKNEDPIIYPNNVLHIDFE
jgi:hypothetical protein